MLGNRPIFVVGYMHSGTTLLLNILRRHSHLFSRGGETKYFDSYPILRQMFPNLNDDKTLKGLIAFTIDVVHGQKSLVNVAPWKDASHSSVSLSDAQLEALVTRVGSHREYGRVFSVVFDYCAESEGKSRWLEKTPTHIFHIDEIVRSVPNARFVEIVRDPRDVLASKKTRRMTVWTSGRYTAAQRPFKHLEKAYDPLWDALAWKAAIRAGQEAVLHYASQVFRVRYEDLVQDPERHVHSICEFLGLPFESGMLDISYRNAADWQDSKNAGITTASVGRWQNILGSAEVAICQLATRSEMKALEYEPMEIPRRKSLKVPLYLARSSGEFGLRLYRKWRLAGSRYLVNVVINYWKRLLKLVHI